MKRTKAVEELIPLLEAEDAFTRLDGEKRLRDLAQRDFGFRWDGRAEDRAAAVARVREWLDRARQSAKSRRAAASLLPGSPMLDIAKLKGMSPKEVEKHLQELLTKSPMLAGLVVGRPPCQACAKRPATVEVVEVRSGRARGVTRLCDPCAAERGQAQAG